ncbi:uncharacterized protein LOC143033984 isoform X2 [Oratosquilla oratoria]|uniref:uncharacterized protein LOC143033984 isoform X2 n=1 Tax=Oratosquilla oratoria TaxID=337810 RepID=UPI003F769CCD
MTSPYFPQMKILWFLLLLLLPASECVVVKEVAVPAYKERGNSAKLTCHYNLEGAALYSVKWYKDDKQFFQYIPANPQPMSTFNVMGIHVDLELSDRKTVVLNTLELWSTGCYKCEVITEGPKFLTKFGEGNMTVFDLPESAPVLEGARTSYQIGDQVHVNCTSPFSKPAASLEWYINDKIAPHSYMRRYPVIHESDGLETAVLGLLFKATRKHFPKGELKLKCEAKIATVYFQSQETSVIETNFLHQTQAEESRRPDKRFLFGGGATVSTALSNVILIFSSLVAVLSTLST